ncbi:beta strand repeat-containing protein, partial [Neoroseomonas rubea]|uniref:beta strand repeat-containing protein n=1 Tax=Neoroseomonas rubea TaxID=2748666 RepID=UPI0018DF84F1
ASGGTRELVAQAGAGSLGLVGSGSFRVADGGADPRGLAAPGDISINLGTSGSLTLAAPVEAGGTATLAARSIAIEAALDAPTAVNLTASGGGAASSITQTAAGVITTALLTANAAGAIDLAEAPNQVGNLGTFSFDGAFGYRTNGPITVSGTIAPTTAGSNADITLIASSVDVNAAITAGAGTVTLQATAGNVAQTASGTISAGRLEASATGSVLLEAAPNAVGTFGAGGAGSTFALRTGQSLTIEEALSQGAGGGILRLTTDGTLTVANTGSIAFSDITLAAALGMTISGDVGQAGATVRLGAGGAITQTATGGITAGTLGLYAPGDIALTAGTNSVGAIAAFATGAFTYRGSGAVSTTTVAGVVRPFFNPFLPGGFVFIPETVSGIRAASADITADSLRVRAATGGSGLGEGVAATAADGLVRLRVDGLAIDADSAITAGTNPAFGGTIDIATRTAGRNIVIGADNAGALALGPGTLGRLYAQAVAIGATGAGAGTLTVAGPATSNAVNELALRGASIGIDGALSMFGSGRLSLTAATGDIAQSAGGSISAPNLVATATLGDVRLDVAGAANGIAGTVAGSAGGGDFAFRNTGNVSVAAPGITATGGTVTLVSTGGGVSQGAGAPITTGTLIANAPGTVTLDLGTNAVAALGAGSAGGAGFTLRSNRTLTVNGVASSGGAITLESTGQMTLAGDVSAPTGRVLLRTGAGFDTPGAGGITQTGGIITAAGLAASAGGTIALTGANQIAWLDPGADAAGTASTRSIVSGADFTLSNARADIPFFFGSIPGLIVGAPVAVGTGGTIALLTNGLGINFAGTAFLAPGGTVRFAPFTDGRSINIGGAAAGATNISTGTLQQVSAGRLVIGGTTGQGGTSGDIVFSAPVSLPGVTTLELQSGGAIAGNAQAITVSRVSAFATGDISLGGVGGSIGGVAAGSGRPEGIATDGAVTIVAGGTGTFAVDAAIEAGAGRTIALQAADFAIGANVGTAAGTPGRIELTGTQTVSLGGTGALGGTARLEAAELARLDAAGGAIRIAGPAIRLDGTWTLDPADAARLEMLLLAGGAGSITQFGGTLSAGTLVIDARQGAGVVTIDRAGNGIGTLDALTLGPLSVATDGALSVQRANATAGNITLSGGSITLAETPGLAVRAQSGNVALTATAGNITGTTPLAAVAGTTLTASALAGEVRLSGDNTVGTFIATARDGVLFRNTGALTAGATGGGGAAVAGAVDIRATALTLNDIRATGTVTLDATAGDTVMAGIHAYTEAMLPPAAG